MARPARERQSLSLQILQLGLILSTSTSVSAFGTHGGKPMGFVPPVRHLRTVGKPDQSPSVLLFQKPHAFRVHSRLALQRFDDATETQSQKSSQNEFYERENDINGNSNNDFSDNRQHIPTKSIQQTSSPPQKTSQKRRRPKNIRMEIFAFLSSSRVEVFSALTVFLTTFLVAINTLESLPTIPLPNGSQLDIHVGIENSLAAINLLFASDFFLRWYAAGNFKLRYLKTPLVLLDILVILLPLWLSVIVPMIDAMAAFSFSSTSTIDVSNGPTFDFEGLQNLMLLRVLRLNRVLTDIKTFERFEVALGIKSRDVRPYQLQLARVILSIFTLLSVASGLIYTAEHKVNPQIPDYFSALYFGLTTLTTVGFGDITPVTAEGRLIVGLSIFAGVTIIPAQAATLVDAILQFQDDRQSKRGRGRQVSFRSNTNSVSTSNNPRPQSMVEPATMPNTSTTDDVTNNGNILTSAVDATASAKQDGINPRTNIGTNAPVSQSSFTLAQVEQSPSSSSTLEPVAMRNGSSSSTVETIAVTPDLSGASTEGSRIGAVEDTWVGWMGLCCLECGESDHREDASYCWHCGSEL